MFRVRTKPEGNARRCWCGDIYMHHARGGGRCLVCTCVGFKAGGVNPQHMWAVAPARRTEYNGTWYDSKGEADYAAHLDWRLKAKDIASWKYHPVIILEWNGEKIARYELDFEITHLDGRRELVEVKGFPTREWKKKWAMAKAMFKGREDVWLTLVPI